MHRRLNFAPASAHLTIPDQFVKDLLSGCQSSDVLAWMEGVARAVNTLPCGVVFGIGKLRLSLDASRALAHSLASTLCEALKRSGAPREMHVEIDRPQKTSVVENHQVRTLLPHHDGGHCSYLTPSRRHDPAWEARLRTFSSQPGYTTTQAHKLYQGIFIAEPGEGLSVTTYYDFLQILRRAYACQTGSEARSVEQLAAWLGGNIRASLDLQPQHQSRYLTLGAALGARQIVYHALSIHYAEADFTDEEIERFPELVRFRAGEAGDDGRAESPTIRFLNQMLLDTLRLTWAEFLSTYEICVPGERFDFVCGHNLGLLHGGLMGGPGRLLEPICMVVDEASGEGYEDWLAQVWLRGARGKQ